MKYEEKIIFKLRSLYESRGYRAFKMSKFEEYDLYLKNKDFLVGDNIITFNDTDGRLLALKPDVTLSIIKNSVDEPGYTHKVYYNENVYRVSSRTHTYKEIMQTGLECIGDIGVYEIAEVILLAAESLAAVCEDFILDISHMGILAGLLEGIEDSLVQKQIIECVSEKNTHDLMKICETAGVPSDICGKLVEFTGIYGNMETVISRLDALGLNENALSALDEMKYLCSILKNSRFGEKIHFDFSIANDMNYYNGILFKGFIAGIPDSVLSGGRYDKLLKKMGRKSGAIGFAVYLDVLEYLDSSSDEYDVDALLIYSREADAALVMKSVSELIGELGTVSAQKAVPSKLRAKRVFMLDAAGNMTQTEGALND